MPWIVVRINVFKAQRPDRRHLRDVLAGLRPMEVGCVAGQNDHGSGRIGHQLLGVEVITQPDVKDAGDDCVDTVLRVPVRHQLHTVRHPDPDRVGSAL